MQAIAFINSLGNDLWNYYILCGNKQIGSGISNGFSYDDKAQVLTTSGLIFGNVIDLVFNF
ncbi:MAG: hypothetical protein WC178_04315 [Candidatus Paceibacterota bacterium]